LAALLPLAASGSINESTKPWLNRMLPWLLTLVLYRPMAALIYMIGFTFLGTGNDVTTVMTGLMVLVLAVVAMPAMMRFFSWAGAARVPLHAPRAAPVRAVLVRPVPARQVRRGLRWPPVRWPLSGPARPPTGRRKA